MIFENVNFEVINFQEEKRDILVTIFCLTYNHKKTIENTLDSFLSQQTDFEYEIVIYDDCSDDGTTEIVKNYAKKFPEKIVAFIANENTHGVKSKKIRTEISKSYFSGKYMALCEGDDCWIDNKKLSFEVKILESKKNCTLVTHNFLLCNYDEMKISVANNCTEGIISTADVIKQKPNIHTATMMFHKEDYLMDDDIFFLPGVGDYKFKLYLASKGEVYYIDRVMSLYNWKSEGSWSSKRFSDYKFFLKDCLQQICFLKKYDVYTKGKYRISIKEHIQTYANAMKEDPVVHSRKEALDFLETAEINYPNSKEVKKEAIRFLNISEGNYIDNEWIKGKKIIIWGTGEYSCKLTSELKRNKVKIKAYAISDNSNQKTFKGKKVYSLKDLELDEDTLIMVGIVRLNLEEIISTLDANGIKQYVCPFMFDVSSCDL